MIVDAHAHLGRDVVFDEEQTEEELVAACRAHGVSGAVVQPYICRPYVEDTRTAHDRIYALTRSGGPRFWGMASINPHFRPEDYDGEAERAVRALGFVGLKITPIAHAVHPSSRDALHVFEVARGLGVPVMVHTGAGVPFSDPVSVIDAVESFRDVPVVLAHAGSEMHNQQATYIAGKYDNVFLEPSWAGVIAVGRMVKKLGCSKLLFSSDNIANIPVEMAKYRSVIRDPDDLDKVFCRNTVSLFKLHTA
jgi:predicted TIM-barrel fold metal-dependent hydrolase